MKSVFRKSLLYLVVFVCAFQALGQEDSLRNHLQEKLNRQETEDALKTYFQLTKFLNINGRFSESWNLYKDQLALIKREYKGIERDSIAGRVMGNLGLSSLRGRIYFQEGVAYYDTAIIRAKQYNLPQLAVRGYVNQSAILSNLNELGEAIDVLENCQDYLNSNPQLFPSTFYNTARVRVLIATGDVYGRLEQWEEAIRLGLKAELIFDEVKRNNQPDSQADKGHVFNGLAIFYMGADSLTKAEKYSAKAVKNYLTAQDKIGLITVRSTRANVLMLLKRYPEARELHDENIALSKSLNYMFGVGRGLSNKGVSFQEQGSFEKALQYLIEAENVILANNSLNQLLTTQKSIIDVLGELKRYKEAFTRLQNYSALKDSVNSIEVENQLNEFNVKYETLEKESQLAELDLTLQTKEATIATQNTRMIAIGGTTLVLLLIGLIYYNRSKAQQKAAFQATLLDEKERGLVAIVEATESERKRISKDLHDGIGQQLSALKLGLQSVKSNVSGPAQEEIEELTDRFSKSADEVRQISHQMMPRSLMENGLVEAMDGLLKNSFRYAEINYNFEHHGIEGRFDEKVEVSLYRILQELVNNVIKHSEATSLSVQLIKSKARLMLLVEDNGKGLGSGNKEGHGLLNIKNRLDIINGEVNFEPSPESGVLATVVVPV